jgi:hypothetical protein
LIVFGVAQIISQTFYSDEFMESVEDDDGVADVEGTAMEVSFYHVSEAHEIDEDGSVFNTAQVSSI